MTSESERDPSAAWSIRVASRDIGISPRLDDVPIVDAPPSAYSRSAGIRSTLRQKLTACPGRDGYRACVDPLAPFGRQEPCWCGSGKTYRLCHKRWATPPQSQPGDPTPPDPPEDAIFLSPRVSLARGALSNAMPAGTPITMPAAPSEPPAVSPELRRARHRDVPDGRARFVGPRPRATARRPAAPTVSPARQHRRSPARTA